MKYYNGAFMNNKRVDWIFLIISIDILLIICETTSITSFDPNSFYYIVQLPYYYYIGLVTILIVILRNLCTGLENKMKNAISITLLCFYIGAIRNYIVPGFHHFDVYGYLPVITSTLNSGYLIQNNSTIYYTEYPIGAIFFSVLKVICNIDYMHLSIYYQTFVDIIFPLFIFLISFTISKFVGTGYEKYVFVPSLIISTSLIGVLVPLSYAILMYCLFVYLCIKNMLIETINSKILAIYFGVVIVLTNPTTAYLMLIGLTVPSILSIDTLKVKVSNYFILFITLLLSQTYYRSIVTSTTIINAIKSFLSFDLTATTNRINIASPNISFLIDYTIYKLKLILIVLLSILSSLVIINRLRKNKSKIDFFILSSLSSFILLFVIGFIALPGFIERPIIFITIYLSISFPFLLYHLEMKNVSTNLAIAAVILLVLMTFINTGWYDSYNVVPMSEISGGNFVDKHPELDMSYNPFPKNIYIKRSTNFEILRGEKIDGYLKNIERKKAIYNNGDFIYYN